MGSDKRDTTIEVTDDQGIKHTVHIPAGAENHTRPAPRSRGARVKRSAYVQGDNDTDPDDLLSMPFQEIYNPENTGDYINAIGQNQDFMQVAEGYGGLSDKQQAAVYLWMFRKAGPAEIGRCLGISTPAASQLLNRALNILKNVNFCSTAANSKGGLDA